MYEYADGDDAEESKNLMMKERVAESAKLNDALD